MRGVFQRTLICRPYTRLTSLHDLLALLLCLCGEKIIRSVALDMRDDEYRTVKIKKGEPRARPGIKR